ncbi:serine/threonine protein kinase [Luteolibacter arcticus]|uniref:Serine/threonine protein kinase n=1 Tax=Luteolibacter arcticus TaxID=1581411 RepID=A0ABT3GHP9_9BACT|nr:serine/threonine-protein kinase [Luteolibacter arcticus]MCW1922779.1 serine/threonine protein kinase [Luteolibacter arcticus]
MNPSINEMLFTAAANFRESAVRRAFLQFACHGDEARLKRLEEMLEIQEDAEDFFDLQPVAPAMNEFTGEGEAGLDARIGPYHLIDRLGAGGCGVVYLAEQREPVKRKVALKIVRLGMDTESVIARFNLEREALAMMDHPNIARVLDGGATPSGRPYFVMELVDGEKITDYCDRKRLGIRARLELFTLVCEAIQHAHQKGVIHRDIKPSNVLVREHDGRAEPKVIDFGIAKATGGGLDAEGTVTMAGQIIGTPAYMSPEQAEGGVDIDTRTDIYSLGALLCELLTGRPPLTHDHFKDRGIEEIRTIVRESDTGVPSVRLRDIPQDDIGRIAGDRGVDPQRLPSMLAGDLDWIVMKAVETERHRRYETANGLAMDVQRYLHEEAVLARPPSRRYLLAKLVRRNRVTFAAAGIALFGLLGGLTLSTWLFLRERDARQEQARLRLVAEEARAKAEAGDLVTQAAVRLKYNDDEEADRLLDGLPAERVPRSLEAVGTLMRVANWNLGKGRLDAAAERFYLLGHVLTSVDMTDSQYISFDLLSVMTAVCEWGEPGQFEELRLLVIKRFADTANPVVAEHVVKATLLKPASPAILEKILPLARVLEGSLDDPPTGKGPHMVAWREFSLALMAYRQGEGHFEEAAELARSSLARSTSSDHRAVSNHLILAMIDMQQRRAPASDIPLTEMRRKVDLWTKEPLQLLNADGTLWYNQWAVLILLREAEKMSAERGG